MAERIGIEVRAKDSATKALRGIGKQVQGFAKGLSTAFIGLAGAGAAVIGGLGAIVVKASASADMIDKMAERTGLTREQLQELNFVAGQSSIPMQDIETAIKGLVQRLPALIKGEGDAAEAFKKLGVPLVTLTPAMRAQIEALQDIKDPTERAAAAQKLITDNLRPMSELFPEVIDALRKIENPTERAAAAQLLLSESGAKLMPILNMTQEQYDALKKKAHELGLVLTDEQIKALVGVGDKWNELQQIMAGVRNQMALSLLPFIQGELVPFIEQSVIPQMREWAGSIRDLVKAFSELDPKTKDFLNKAIAFAAVVTAASGAIGILGKVLAPLKALLVGAIIPAMVWLGGVLNAVWAGTSMTVVLPAIASLGAALVALGAGPVGMMIAAFLLAIEVGKLLVANWDTIKEAAVRIWGDIADWIDSVVTKISNWFLGLATAAVDWGRGMMQGFLTGITGMFGTIRAKVGAFVQSMVDKVKGVLGMHSPSRVFADIGQNAGQSMLDAFGKSLKTTTPSVAGGVVPALTGAGAGRSVSFSPTFHLNGANMSQRDLERMLQQWWGRATRAGGL